MREGKGEREREVRGEFSISVSIFGAGGGARERKKKKKKKEKISPMIWEHRRILLRLFLRATSITSVQYSLIDKKEK